MENVFVKYLSKKAKKEEVKVFEAGPVITISRQYGCYATEIANHLVELINKKSPNSWDVITKEILEESAKKLDVSKHEIAHIFGATGKSFLSDIIVSFSPKSYRSDNIIIKTIRSVVKKYAEQGNCIIVGRAGCIIAGHIKKAVHIKVNAPFNYRKKIIKTRFNITNKEAEIRIAEIDKKRADFMGFFKGNKSDEEIFELCLNRGLLNKLEISEIIMNLIEKRGLV